MEWKHWGLPAFLELALTKASKLDLFKVAGTQWSESESLSKSEPEMQVKVSNECQWSFSNHLCIIVGFVFFYQIT